MIATGEFFLLHPVFITILEKELGHAIPLPQGVEEAFTRQNSLPGEQTAPEPWVQWLSVLDLAISPHKVRSYVTSEDAPDRVIVALIRFAVAKKSHTEADRDKLDWLLTHLFKKREEQRGIPTGWPRVEVQEILRGYQFDALGQYAQEVLMEVPVLLDEIKYFSSFHQITDSRAV